MNQPTEPSPPALDRDSVLEHNPRLAAQELGEKSVLLHYEGRKILGLNETGSRVWSLIDGVRSLGQIIDQLSAESSVPVEQVSEDVLSFVAQLRERELVQSAGE